MQNNEINSRIYKIRECFCDGNNQNFATKVGVTNQQSSQLCSGTTRPGTKMLEKILTAFPQVSRAWLILGEGEMITQGGNTISTMHQTGDNYQSSVVNGDTDIVKDLLAEKDARIKDQAATIVELREFIKVLREQLLIIAQDTNNIVRDK